MMAPILFLNIVKGKRGSILTPISNPDRAYLAKINTYQQAGENCGYDHLSPMGRREEESLRVSGRGEQTG
jgi:hypothetical protein